MRAIYLFFFLALANIITAQDSWHRLYNRAGITKDFHVLDAEYVGGNVYVLGYTRDISTQKDTTLVFFSQLDAFGKIKDQKKFDKPFGKNVTGGIAITELGVNYSIASDLEDKLYQGTIEGESTSTDDKVDFTDRLTSFDGSWAAFLSNETLYINTYDADNTAKSNVKIDDAHIITLEDITYSNIDSTAWAVGKSSANELWISHLDSLGNPIDFHTISPQLMANEINIVGTTDTTYVLSLSDNNQSQIVFGDMKKDSIHHRSIAYLGKGVNITDLTFEDEVKMSGTYNVATDYNQHLSAGMQADGTMTFVTTYRKDSTVIGKNPIIKQDEDSFIVVGQAYNTSKDSSMVVFKHDQTNQALCSSVENVLTWKKVAENNATPFAVKVEKYTPTITDPALATTGFTAFNAPIVIIEIPECILQPVNVPLKAEIDVPADKVSFEWNTGAKTDEIVATKADEPYIVTTTVDYEECYILKDTVTLTLSKPPVVTIGGQLQSNCDFILIPNIEDGTPDFTYEWSDNTTGQTTIGTKDNNYTLKVTDKCGLSGTGSVTPQIPTPAIRFVVDQKEDCTADVTALINSATPYTVEWNTSETTEVINTTSNGTYSITVNANCVDPTTASTDVEIKCNLAECIQYPDSFFPDGNEEIEKTFGPVVTPGCSDDLSVYKDYEFAVYNRWGNQVFSTNAINEQWNGGNHVEEVYIWYAKYKIANSDEVITQKGDVTLFR